MHVSLPNGVFLPCDHGLNFDIISTMCEKSINQSSFKQSTRDSFGFRKLMRNCIESTTVYNREENYLCAVRLHLSPYRDTTTKIFRNK